MPYPHERQIEYWTSRAIEDYFSNDGYSVIVLPNSQRFEKEVPFDHLFAGEGVKVFGLQYKRLHNSSSSDYWRIDLQQHKQLQKFAWIYYALTEITSIKQSRNAIHLLRLVESATIERPIRANPSGSSSFQLHQHLVTGRANAPYYRWGGFVSALFNCYAGWRPTTVDECISVLRDAVELLSVFVDLYIVPIGQRPIVRVTPFGTATDVQDAQQEYDFGI